MLKRLISILICVLALAVPAAVARAQQAPQTQTPQPKREMVRVFLDCNHCDEDYIRKEVTFVDYVRNREDADVHVLVSIQETGGGGVQWTLKFIGLGPFQGSDQTLTYNSPAASTSDEMRAGFSEVFKVGLVRYAATTPVADRLRVTFKKIEGDAAAAKKKDPWNYWVFRVGLNGDVNGEESSKGRSVRGSVSANRTTDAWRMSFNTSANYRDSEFKLEEEDGRDEVDDPEHQSEPGRQRHRGQEPQPALVARGPWIGELTDVQKLHRQDPGRVGHRVQHLSLQRVDPADADVPVHRGPRLPA
jgi:hypothetical protein